ncbi:MAG: DUF1292 domain-containing protein, partial [Myxococcales bacterium]|nr:DUF1292 domain-containing protein [Myxococcales bacterium]
MDEQELGFDDSHTLGEDDLVTLVGEDGAEVECVLLAVLEHEGATYAVLTPRTELDVDGALWVAHYEEGA